MRLKLAYILIGISILPPVLHAQDRMVLVPNLDTLFVQVKEIGSDQIFYYTWNEREQQNLLSIEKNKIGRLLLEDGRVYRFAEIKNLPVYKEIYPKSAFKFDFFSTFYGSTHLAYEHRYKPRNSYEFGIGFLGLGFNKDLSGNIEGLMLRASYKHYLKPYNLRKRDFPQQLKGWYYRADFSAHGYVQDEFVLHIDKYTYIPGTTIFSLHRTDKHYRRYGSALVLNFGRQFLIKEKICLDLFYGMGCGFGGQKVLHRSESYYEETGYKWMDTADDLGDSSLGAGFSINHAKAVSFAFQIGFKVGYCFDW
ncbi:MAG: hypothetical protein K9I36_07690 [Bacteroidia bacterium]|nr:hypothetical protein [Bacteroidia bacterium]